MTPTIYLLHGRDSSPQSTKIKHMSIVAEQAGWKVVAPDFSTTKNPDERVTMFLELAQENPSMSVIVGSSMGGYVALVASKILNPAALLLLAPAVNIDGYREQNPEPLAGKTTIIHGWNDELIDPGAVMSFAAFHQTTLHMVDDNHMLQQSIPFIESVLKNILRGCHPAPRKARVIAAL